MATTTTAKDQDKARATTHATAAAAKDHGKATVTKEQDKANTAHENSKKTATTSSRPAATKTQQRASEHAAEKAVRSTVARAPKRKEGEDLVDDEAKVRISEAVIDASTRTQSVIDDAADRAESFVADATNRVRTVVDGAADRAQGALADASDRNFRRQREVSASLELTAEAANTYLAQIREAGRVFVNTYASSTSATIRAALKLQGVLISPVLVLFERGGDRARTIADQAQDIARQAQNALETTARTVEGLTTGDAALEVINRSTTIEVGTPGAPAEVVKQETAIDLITERGTTEISVGHIGTQHAHGHQK